MELWAQAVPGLGADCTHLRNASHTFLLDSPVFAGRPGRRQCVEAWRKRGGIAGEQLRKQRPLCIISLPHHNDDRRSIHALPMGILRRDRKLGVPVPGIGPCIDGRAHILRDCPNSLHCQLLHLVHPCAVPYCDVGGNMHKGTCSLVSKVCSFLPGSKTAPHVEMAWSWPAQARHMKSAHPSLFGTEWSLLTCISSLALQVLFDTAERRVVWVHMRDERITAVGCSSWRENQCVPSATGHWATDLTPG
mmetsp:Transcript_9679/g.27673  ORF Transcript_9679/g.27673 Transcript_9679/m.27673 type:complete len:248 (-) Transcript_9679:362-1105(-)